MSLFIYLCRPSPPNDSLLVFHDFDLLEATNFWGVPCSFFWGRAIKNGLDTFVLGIRTSCDPKHLKNHAPSSPAHLKSFQKQAGPCVQQERFSIVVDADPELALSSGSNFFGEEKKMNTLR